MEKTLIIYHTTDGHTKKIAEYIKENINSKKNNVEIKNIKDKIENIELFKYILIASPIRYGKYNKNITEFINKNYNVLNQKKSAFIGINLVARKKNKNTSETNIYTKKLMKKIDWKPKEILVLGGKLNYSIYRFFDKYIIKFIMYLTGGPTDTKTIIDYTDYEKIKVFCREFIK